MLKIQILDDDDFKRFEDHMARALVRALRTVMKEGLVAGYKPPAAEKFAEPQTELPPTTTIQPGAVPMPTSYVHGHNGTVPITPPLPSVAPSRPPPPSDEKLNRKLRDYCKSVAVRPTGFIDSDEAAKLIGGEEIATKALIRNWIFAGQVTGVAVCDQKMVPTKGMPGRLHVDRSELLERNRIRKLNAGLPIPLRRANGTDHEAAAAD